MEQLPSPALANAWCQDQRAHGFSVGFVPTMGALHEGHLSLVRQALAENDRVCASIFVNPLQFNNQADLENYPLDMASDLRAFAEMGCHMVFTGELLQFFPDVDDPENIPKRSAGPFGHGLEGDHRPGHLDGVATIVEKLFTTAGDCTAYFGEKDYQQTLVVKALANDLQDEGLHIRIRVCPTVRDSQGLALSSRNQRLSADQKQLACSLHRSLQAARTLWLEGETRIDLLEQAMAKELAHPDITPEYAVIRDEVNWNDGGNELIRPRGLVAVDIGGVRLIDNLSLVD